MYPVPPCPSASTSSPTAPALLPSSSEKPGARGNESGDRPSPTFRKSPNPSSTPSALSSKAALSLKPSTMPPPSEGVPHGHVAALLGLATQLGLPRILNRKPCRQRDLALAAVIARLIHPASKLATARAVPRDRRQQPRGPARPRGRLWKRAARHARLAQQPPNRTKSFPQASSQHHPDPLRRDLDLPRGAAMPVGRAVTMATERRGKSRWSFCAASVFPGNTADPTTLAAQVRDPGSERRAVTGSTVTSANC